MTSHNMQEIVTTLMDDAGLSARSAAGQLRHANPSLTQEVSFGRVARLPVLEVLGYYRRSRPSVQLLNVAHTGPSCRLKDLMNLVTADGSMS